MSAGPEHDIFVSYTGDDASRVRALVSALQAEGWTVFWDHDIPAGESWEGYIGVHLERAAAVVVVWSALSINSQWVRSEANHAGKRKVLVPVLFDVVDPPLGLDHIKASDLVEWSRSGGGALPEHLTRSIKLKLSARHVDDPATNEMTEGGGRRDREFDRPARSTSKESSRDTGGAHSPGAEVTKRAVMIAVLMLVGLGAVLWYLERSQDRKLADLGDQLAAQSRELETARSQLKEKDQQLEAVTRELRQRTQEVAALNQKLAAVNPSSKEAPAGDLAKVNADATRAAEQFRRSAPASAIGFQKKRSGDSNKPWEITLYLDLPADVLEQIRNVEWEFPGYRGASLASRGYVQFLAPSICEKPTDKLDVKATATFRNGVRQQLVWNSVCDTWNRQ